MQSLNCCHHPMVAPDKIIVWWNNSSHGIWHQGRHLDLCWLSDGHITHWQGVGGVAQVQQCGISRVAANLLVADDGNVSHMTLGHGMTQLSSNAKVPQLCERGVLLRFRLYLTNSTAWIPPCVEEAHVKIETKLWTTLKSSSLWLVPPLWIQLSKYVL